MTCRIREICHRNWFGIWKVLCFCFFAKYTSPNTELVCDSDSSIRGSKAKSQKTSTFDQIPQGFWIRLLWSCIVFSRQQIDIPAVFLFLGRAIAESRITSKASVGKPVLAAATEHAAWAVRRVRANGSKSAHRFTRKRSTAHDFTFFSYASSMGNKK